MTHNLAPLYLSSLVPQSVSNISRYNLRNSNNHQTIDARTTLYYNSFLPSTVRAWNNVNNEVKQSDSLSTFKGFLNKDKLLVPKHFYVGHRKVQVLHTGLRTNYSSLNLDLFTSKMSDSPLCQCGSVENAQHFFFHCRYFQVPRTELMNTVSRYQNPSLSLILYGNEPSKEPCPKLRLLTGTYILQENRAKINQYAISCLLCGAGAETHTHLLQSARHWDVLGIVLWMI